MSIHPEFENGGLTFDGLCTVTMQGGGIFGFALLGQLQAVKDCTGMRPVAYAGASAGGLMATLRWAGLKPTDIRDEFERLVADKKRLSDLLGSGTKAGQETEWSANPTAVIRVRDRLKNLFEFESKPNAGRFDKIRRWIVILKHSMLLSPRLLLFSWKIWKKGGLFAARGFTDWLDNILRDRLQTELNEAAIELERTAKLGDGDAQALLKSLPAWLSEIGLPDPASEAFGSHRPRFIDFDLVRHILPTAKTRPVLLLSVTSISRREPLFIDSYRSAFEHLVISDVVRATIAYPFVFQPSRLGIIREYRDNTDGDIATRESLFRHHRSRGPRLKVSNEDFIDGGVMANFPIWAVARYLRQTLYGHTVERPFEGIRLSDQPFYAQAPFRERFTRDGLGIASQHSEFPSSAEGPNRDLDIPLRALAFRPMLHIGLRLLETKTPKFPGSIIYSIIALLTSGARSFHENLALTEGNRFVLTEQSAAATGWDHQLLDFDKLEPGDITRMFENGRREAHRSLEKITLDFPSTDTSKDIIGQNNIPALLRSAADAARQIDITSASDQRNMSKISVRLYLLSATNLNEVGFVGTPAAEKTISLLESESTTPEQCAYHERRALIIRKGAPWWTQATDPKLSTRIVLPIVDLTFADRSPLSAVSDAQLPNDSLLKGVDRDAWAIRLGAKVYTVIFGILSIDIEVSIGSDHDISAVELEAGKKVFWEGLVGHLVRRDERFATSIRGLQAEADRMSALLTKSFSECGNLLLRGAPPVKKDPEFDPVAPLSWRETEMLRKFFAPE